MAKSVYVLNGPNLNLLGTREPDTFGGATLKDVERRCRDCAARHKLDLEFRQSNHEGDLIDWIQEAGAKKAVGVVLNAGGYTHTSVSIRDAVAAVSIPVVEVHISNIFSRDRFRHPSPIPPIAHASPCGFRTHGDPPAIDGLAARI